MRNGGSQNLPPQYSHPMAELYPSLWRTPCLLGVGNGRLLPTSHQPYETSAPREDFEARSPAPEQQVHMRPQDASAAHNPMPAAAVGDTGVSGGLSWDQDRGLEPSSEKDGEGQRAAQVPLSRAFIDNPFCARRPVLRELPFARPADVGWVVKSTDTAAAWASQDSHQPSASTGARRDPAFSGRFPEGDDSGHSEVEEARQRFGREAQDPLLETSPHNTRSLWPSAPSLENQERGMDGIPPCWREGHGTGNLDQLDEGADWRKPAWEESGEGKKETDARHDEGQKRMNSPYQEELAFRGSRGAEANIEHMYEVGGCQ